MKNILLLLAFVTLFSACKKSTPNVTPVVTPPVTDSTPSQYGTPFAGVPDRQDANIYQVNIRAFSAQGNFAAVTARLDSIKALGINVIYLMPIFPVGILNSVNSPYCVRDYLQVNTEFGTLTDLHTLIDNAHSKNMSVILDWVANHTSWDNPWITSHRDWYLQDSLGNILSPPGMGWNDVAQLNYTNAAMRLQMIKDMQYWVYTANIDGFRCDYADGPPLDFWTQAIDSIRNITTHKFLFLAESNDNAKYTTGFDYIFGFNFYGNLKNIYSSNEAVTTIDALNNSDYVDASNGQQVVRYLTNHDVNSSDGTPLELFGGINGSMAAFVVAAYMKSVPMIYNGQEVATPFQIIFPFTTTKLTWVPNPAVTNQYKAVLAFRNSSLAIRRGDLTSYSNADICAFTKTATGDTAFVVSNLRNVAINYTIPSGLVNTTWQDVMNGGNVTLSSQLTLQPYSFYVLDK
jgi:glycosidase